MWGKAYKMEEQDVKLPFIKATSAWLTILLSSMWQTFSDVPWDVLAQFAAFAYSAALLGEWIWKKVKQRKLDCGTD